MKASKNLLFKKSIGVISLIAIALLFTQFSFAQTGTVVIKKTTEPATSENEFFFFTYAAVIVNSPASISGQFFAGDANFGPQLGLTGPSADVVVVNDGIGVTSDGCEPIVNDLTGKIALIDRGSCTFQLKVSNAEAMGAIGVIIVNVTGDNSIVTMAGTNAGIPSLFIGYDDGQIIKNELAIGNPVNVTLSGGLFNNLSLKHGEQESISNVPAGTYYIFESNPLLSTFVLDDIVLTDPDNESSAFIPGLSAVLDVDAGETVICEFVNYSPIYGLREKITLLYDDGYLNKGQSNALNVKLDQAEKNIAKPKFGPAINQLNAFINQVMDFINEGVLTSSQGDPLIDEANVMIAILEGYPGLKSDIVQEPAESTPFSGELSQNYPNPFVNSTTIRFTLEESDFATLRIVNVDGKEVARPFEGMAEGGQEYTLEISAEELTDGIYFYQLSTAQGISTMKKMILLR